MKQVNAWLPQQVLLTKTQPFVLLCRVCSWALVDKGNSGERTCNFCKEEGRVHLKSLQEGERKVTLVSLFLPWSGCTVHVSPYPGPQNLACLTSGPFLLLLCPFPSALPSASSYTLLVKIFLPTYTYAHR